MGLNITIRYPGVSDTVTSEALATLRSFGPALSDQMVQVMCSTSNYRWEHASELESDVYFTLIKTHKDAGGNREVIKIGLRELSKIRPSDLLGRIRLKQVFPENRPSTLNK